MIASVPRDCDNLYFCALLRVIIPTLSFLNRFAVSKYAYRNGVATTLFSALVYLGTLLGRMTTSCS